MAIVKEAAATCAAKTLEQSAESLSEEIIRKYKILDEKCEEVLKKIKKKRKTNIK